MDGADDGTVFTDSSLGGVNSPHAVTRYNAVTKTGVKKFGTASGYFDGSGDYLSLANSDDWVFGSGDFTIDFWTRLASLPASDAYMVFIGRYDTSSKRMFRVSLLGEDDGESVSYKLVFHSSTDGSYQAGNTFEEIWGLVVNTWYHVAITRSGGTLRMFVDGTKLGSDKSNNITYYNTSLAMLVGASFATGTPGSFVACYMDELRISKGIARWTANFTPPTEPYGV
jgi:hypothetical protein